MRRGKLLFLMFSIATCLLVLLAGRLAWAAEKGEELTLEKVLALSAKENPILLAADSRVRQAEGRLVQVESEARPQLYGTLGYQWLDEMPQTNAYLPDGTVGIVPLGYKDTAQAALNLTQVIFTGGSLSAKTEASKLLLATARSERDRAYQSVENGIRRSFFSLQRSVSRLDVAREALSLSKEHLRQVESFYKAGVVAQNEVLRVQVAVSSSELNRIRAESAVEISWKTLERLAGHPLKEHFSVRAGDVDLENFPVPEDPVSLAMERRPELKGLETAGKAALATERAVRGQVYPQVGLNAQVSLTDDHFFPSEEDHWSIGIVAKLRLVDSGKVHGQALEAKAAAEELLNRLEDLKRQVSLEVATARVNLEASVQSVKVASDAVARAEEDYRMALKRYQAQVGTNIDVLDARLALTDARNSLTDAVAEARTAYGDLLFAMGDLRVLEKKEATR